MIETNKKESNMNYGKLTIGIILLVLGTVLALFTLFLMGYIVVDEDPYSLVDALFSPGTSLQVFLVLTAAFLVGGYKIANSAKAKEVAVA